MPLRRDERGLVAVFDALVFLIVGIILSVALLLASSLVARETVTSTEDQVLRYAEHTLPTFLQSTLPNVTYTDLDGGRVDRPPGSTAAGILIAEDLALRDEGASGANVASLESALTRQLRSLVRGDLDFLLEAKYGLQTIYLPLNTDRGDLPRRTYAATQEFAMIYGKPGEVTVVLWLWPRV